MNKHSRVTSASRVSSQCPYDVIPVLDTGIPKKDDVIRVADTGI
ncbi:MULTISPECIES: hypothetical protein [unclassified Wolbachia]|nr:hypothetical protein [Wolbachia endosymbiont of Psylliodes chrysocephala]